MPDLSTSIQIPKPADFASFQRKCRVLFEHILGDPNVKEFGTSGQDQNGIDLLGIRKKSGSDHWVGVQCKLTIKAAKLDKSVIRKEATDALSFEPALKELLIATTAPDHVALDQEAAAFTDEQAKAGRDFRVSVMGWDTLQSYVLQYPDALDAFMPGVRQLSKLEVGQGQIQEDVTATKDNVVQIREQLSVLLQHVTPLSAEGSTGSRDAEFNTHLDKEIDRYRKLLESGKPVSAFDLLTEMWNSLTGTEQPRIRFRVRANMGACQMRLGNYDTAADLYLEAYEHDPDNARACSMRVLGLLLKDRPQEAFDFATDRIRVHPDEMALYAHGILAASYLEFDEIPFSVPDAIASAPTVITTRSEFYRKKGNLEAVAEGLQAALEEHPDEDSILRLWSEFTVDEAVKWLDASGRQVLPPEMKAQVQLAVTRLERLWNGARKSEDAATEVSLALCNNLSVAHRLLGQRAEAESVIDEGLKVAPDGATLLTAKLVVLLEQGKDVDAVAISERAPVTRDSIVGTALACANSSQWEKLLKHTARAATFETPLVDDDKAVLDALDLLARHQLGLVEDFRKEAADLLAKHPATINVPLILYQAAANRGDPGHADELFRAALELRETIDSATRLNLARAAEQNDRADVVIELLGGHIDLTKDSPDLRRLARAHVNDGGSLASVEFVESLAPELIKQGFYARVVASIYFNAGSMPQAEKHFATALDSDATDIQTHIGLLTTLFRQDRLEECRQHVTRIDVESISGTAHQRMHLAHFLARFGRGADALSLAFETVQANRDDELVALKYIGLILPGPITVQLPPGPDCVEADAWVKLGRTGGEVQGAYIAIGDGQPSRNVFGLSHPFTQALLGKCVGDEVSYAPHSGPAQKWTVLEIKHKYLALLHEILEAFPLQFPDASGFRQFKIEKGDLSPILEQTRAHSEYQKSLVDGYTSGKVPLSVVAAMAGKCSVALADQIARDGSSIVSCVGTPAEREAAIAIIEDNMSGGIVFDTYAAWLVSVLDLTKLMKTLFGRLAVTQSVLDELLEWRQEYESHGDEGIMTIGYRGGEYIREEIPAEGIKSSIATIQGVIDDIRANMEVLPAAPSGALSELEQTFHNVGSRDVLNPVYAAKAENLVFVSEDMRMRLVAQDVLGAAAVWLQPILMFAVDRGLYSAKEYAEILVQLAARRHTHISITRQTLERVLLDDETEGSKRFEVVAACLGGENADLKSHWRVGWDFVNEVWTLDLSRLKKSQATGIVLRRLAVLLHSHGLTRRILAAAIRQAASFPPDLAQYLPGWCRGHFIFAGAKDAFPTTRR